MRVLVFALLLALWGGTALADTLQAQIDRCNNSGDPDPRIEACDRLLKSGKFNADDRAHIFNNRGIAYDEKGDHARAIADYDQAIALKPDFSWAFHNRGIAYRRQGNLDRAIADHTEALRLQPKFPEAFNSRGNAYAKKGDYERAIADFTQALSLNPKYPEALYNRGSAYRVTGDNDRALADYDEAIRLDPGYADAFTSRGVVKFNKAAFQEAVTDFKKATTLEPSDAYPQLYLWLAGARQGKAEARILTDFIKTQGSRSDEWSLLLVKFLAGRTDEKDLLKAAGGSSTEATGRRCEASFYAGEAALLRGDRARAAELFNAAIGTNVVDFWEYSSARAELAHLK